MVAESGDLNGLDAAQWLAEWLETPVPALGDAQPKVYLDTAEGQQLHSGVFA